MGGNTRIFASVCLLLCWMLLIHPVRGGNPPSQITSIPLDMSVNAVDDMYFGCTEQMRNKLKNTQDQLSISNKSQKDLKNCLEKAKKKTDNAALTPDHVQAICTYTSDGIYKEFNRAVREDKSKYGKSFPYQSLHFWLTDAIQVLNEARRKALKKPESCETTYRRTHDVFTGKVNDRIRLGSFSSTSRRTDLKDFGKETCFVIETCLAAYVAQYSIYDQEEVLIPPYETFKITKKIEDNKDKPAGLTDCEVIYELKHAGGKSVLNCKTSGVAAAAREVTQQN
ncbi:T-cell ecto-ADP-ribosyltransferase 1 isoform X2 [Lates calcarifer]|nr:T-cell ecto-ADP-ribosyltransferase 1 isoform X2 [Lates calcarifer]XP_050933601.1 T-cell ecto-ADP-ribosyltransferase 1 isoform X2 [Lates calcarifer]